MIRTVKMTRPSSVATPKHNGRRALRAAEFGRVRAPMFGGAPVAFSWQLAGVRKGACVRDQKTS